MYVPKNTDIYIFDDMPLHTVTTNLFILLPILVEIKRTYISPLQDQQTAHLHSPADKLINRKLPDAYIQEHCMKSLHTDREQRYT